MSPFVYYDPIPKAFMLGMSFYKKVKEVRGAFVSADRVGGVPPVGRKAEFYPFWCGL